MLSVAAVGMFSYGLYSLVWAIADLLRGARLELWAEVGLIAFGLLLVAAAALVRVRIPGGLALAVGAMLGLQALAVHSAAHLHQGLAPQLGRAALAVLMAGAAWLSGPDQPAPPVS